MKSPHQPLSGNGENRALVARKYDGSKKKTKPGRKRISEELEELTIQIARKNKTWGPRRIKGQLRLISPDP